TYVHVIWLNRHQTTTYQCCLSAIPDMNLEEVYEQSMRRERERERERERAVCVCMRVFEFELK
ncbi:MAG: hypothetical protein J8272_00605, partial ['Prunus persica' phytoplasma PP2]|nr:hypothetical protein ['Prunus persica' phytoplasma PP2]